FSRVQHQRQRDCHTIGPSGECRMGTEERVESALQERERRLRNLSDTVGTGLQNANSSVL
ncbi:MAG: hypothetical protein WAL24_05675, partial [Nitrososphaeraceae archaeon]